MTLVLKEQIDLERAQWAYSLPDIEFEELMWNETEEAQGEKEMSKETHIREMKKCLKFHLEKQEPVEVKYNYSRNMKTDGRLFAQGYGLAKMKRIARGFLCYNFYNDYDMKNAHPTIIRYVMKHFYKVDFNKEFPALNDYIEQREEFLEHAGLTKVDVL